MSVLTGGDTSNGYGFKYIAAILDLALGVAVTTFADDPGFPAPTGDPAFVPVGAKLERLFDGGCMLTEGVAAGHDGMIYFSDITFTKFCKDSSLTSGWNVHAAMVVLHNTVHVARASKHGGAMPKC